LASFESGIGLWPLSRYSQNSANLFNESRKRSGRLTWQVRTPSAAKAVVDCAGPAARLEAAPFQSESKKNEGKAQSFRNFDRVQLDSRALEWEEFHSLLKTCDFR
jgi:hypothetical protein